MPVVLRKKSGKLRAHAGFATEGEGELKGEWAWEGGGSPLAKFQLISRQNCAIPDTWDKLFEI